MKELISNKSFKILFFIIGIIICISLLKYVGILNTLSLFINTLIPVFIAIFVSFMFEPFIEIFIKRGLKRKYAVLISYLIIISIIGLICYFVFPTFINQTTSFFNNIPLFIEEISLFLSRFNISNSDIFFNNIINKISLKIVNVLNYSFDILFDLLLGISGALFLSFDFPNFKSKIKQIIPQRIKKPVIYYFKNFLPFVYKYFLGLLIDSAFIFIISFIGFKIIKIDYVLIISLFIAITNLIPIIGPYIGGILACLVGFNISKNLGISAVIVVLIVQFIESNIIQPIILKNVISLHPLEGILGISVFGTFFGVIGMIVSPILVVAIKLLFIPYKEEIT